MKTLLMALLSIVFSVAAQFSLKTGISTVEAKEMLAEPFNVRTTFFVLSDKYVLGGFLLYGLGAIVWLGVLSKWEVSKAYPLVGSGFLLALLVGFLIGEQITMPRMLGVIMISAGIWLVATS